MKLFLLVACAAFVLAAEFKGWITDSTCGTENAGSSPAARECAKRCLKNGAIPVFVTENKRQVYKVSKSNADFVKSHLQGKVQVSGFLRGDTIVIAHIVDLKE